MEEKLREEKGCYTYTELMRAVDKLDDREHEKLLSMLKINEILFLMNDEKEYDHYMDCLQQLVEYYMVVYSALEDVKKNIKIPVDEQADFSKGYDALPEEKKMDVALGMLNNPIFQKNCAKILTSDYKRIAKSDPTVGAIDALFGISKYFEKLIEQGIGCKHRYEME